MGAAKACLDDLVFAMEAEETARIVKTHKRLSNGGDKSRLIFSVTVMRGENLLGKGLKSADAFVIITDPETGERLLKSRTVLGVEDPRW